MDYPSSMPIDEIIHKETERIAYKLYLARGFGRAEEDWFMAERIISDSNWLGTGLSYKQVITNYYYNNRHWATKYN
jgi:hypothetical protein